ncbi:MAG TPA: oligosaccharide flippase family protein [Burkholderiales bacterium]|jgi:O-antigen/teichoic acid export membrane protein
MQFRIDEAAPRRMLLRASITAAGTAYRQCISFVSGLIVARVIGAADYGVFNLARSLVEVIGTFTRLGLDLGLQRYFGETNSARDHASRIVLLGRLRLLASAVALVPVIAVALGLGRVLEENVYQYSGFAEVLLCLALALPFVTDIGVLGGAYRGILKLAPAVLAECVLLPTIRLAAILVLFAAGWRLWAVVVGTTLGSLAAAAFLAMRARSDFRGDAPARPQPQPQSWTDALRVIRYSCVLAGSVIVTMLMINMDTFMLGYFATAQELGQYSLVKTLLVLTGAAGAACGQGTEALVADRYFRGDLAGMVRVMCQNARLIALITVPVFAIFLFWGAQLVLLFGPSFAVPQVVVSFLAVVPLVQMFFWPTACGLSMTGRHLLELKILSGGMVMATLLCWFAIPTYGQLGAAVAICVSFATANVARVLVVRSYVGAFSFGGDIFVIAAAGVGLAWATNLVVAQLSLPSFWNAACGIGGFVLAYAAAGWSHLLSESEKSGIRAALRSKVPTLFRKGS